MTEVYMRKTLKGAIYWTYAGVGEDCVKLLAYRYYKPHTSWTRYKIKHGDKKAQTASAKFLSEAYPIALEVLRNASGTRVYNR